MRTLLVLLLSLAAASCAGAAPLEPVAAPLDAPFTLRVGEEAVIEGGGLRLRFEGVPADSRCPSGVACVWAGDAEVRLRATPSAGGEEVLELHTTLEPRAATLAGFRIVLEALRPLPRVDPRLRPEEYTAELRVSRAR